MGPLHAHLTEDECIEIPYVLCLFVQSSWWHVTGKKRLKIFNLQQLRVRSKQRVDSYLG